MTEYTVMVGLLLKDSKKRFLLTKKDTNTKFCRNKWSIPSCELDAKESHVSVLKQIACDFYKEKFNLDVSLDMYLDSFVEAYSNVLFIIFSGHTTNVKEDNIKTNKNLDWFALKDIEMTELCQLQYSIIKKLDDLQ